MVVLEKKEKKRYIILFLSVAFLLRVLSCSIVPESTEKFANHCKPMNTDVTISETEVDDFLEIWKTYIQKGYDKKVQDKVSLMDGSLDESLPFSVKIWLNSRCWSPERFYYVEDRLRAALRTLYLKRHSAGIVSILNENINDKNAAEYQNMIDMQNKIANIENITETELKFVQMREGQITNILNMQ